MSLLNLPLRELHKRMDGGELTATDLVDASLARVKEVEPDVQAFLLVDEEGARVRAKEVDAQLDAQRKSGDERAPLAGLPVGLKDNLSTAGMKMTCASKMLENFTPVYDATVVEKLNAAGTVTIGKLNMDEFAMGTGTETSAFHKTRNPWNVERVPGGSSGGSAAAVAAGEVTFSLGSDTGGSIRQPAAFCGVVGLKPTYGLVSRFGLVAFASSLDQIGPITKNVEDAAYVLQAIAGHDERDSTSAKVDIPNYARQLTGDIKGLKIAVPKELLGDGIDPQVKARVQEALTALEGLGAQWEEVSLPHSEHAVAVYMLLGSAEASSNLARFDGVRYGMRATEANDLLDMYKQTRSEGFGSEVKQRIILGTYALSSDYYDAYYLKAQKVRTLIRREFEELFATYDCIVGPTAPTPAYGIGEKMDPVTAYLADYCTIPANLAGLPAISVPCGLADGLPVGLQIIGKAFDDATVLRVAHAYEQHTDYHRQRPAL